MLTPRDDFARKPCQGPGQAGSAGGLWWTYESIVTIRDRLVTSLCPATASLERFDGAIMDHACPNHPRAWRKESF